MRGGGGGGGRRKQHGKKAGYLYSALHQELFKQKTVKFRKTIRFPINKRRITSTIEFNQSLREYKKGKEFRNKVK